MSDLKLTIIFLSVAAVAMATPFVRLWLQYSRWWHIWRKYKYRIVQTVVVVGYAEDPIIGYVIQKKGWFGWRDNPDVPGFDSYGEFSVWRTEPYKTLNQAQAWMDRIAGVKNGGRKDNVVV